MRRDGTDENVATNTGRDAAYLAGREYGVEAEFMDRPQPQRATPSR